MAACLFCAIAAGDVDADVVRRTDRVVAFRDINPQAPTHVLVIPVDHHRNIAALTRDDPALLAEVYAMAADVADAEGVSGTGWRAVTNTGEQAGQSVDHIHVHVLGGRSLAWPPG